MTRRILHVLSQRPGRTGSGVTLDELVNRAALGGYVQAVVCATPPEEQNLQVGPLPSEHIHTLSFGGGDLPYAIPGMSDVMPYESTVFSTMDSAALASYRRAWQRLVADVVERFRPEVVHAHHVWILSSLLPDLLPPDVTLVIHVHGTGFRQMTLCPHLAQEVIDGCRRADRFLVLHETHAEEVQRRLEVPSSRIHIVGAGYAEGIFNLQGRPSDTRPPALCYAGKYSRAKGLPWLLDAFERMRSANPDLVLHIAGDGAGPEADELRHRMRAQAPQVVLHGALDQGALAHLFKRCDVFVLPSLYEGLPLVLVEALACGCRLVCTDLPGVVKALDPHLGRFTDWVPLPGLIGPDEPRSDDLPAFVKRLAEAVERALSSPAVTLDESLPQALAPFTWQQVFERVERAYV